MSDVHLALRAQQLHAVDIACASLGEDVHGAVLSCYALLSSGECIWYRPAMISIGRMRTSSMSSGPAASAPPTPGFAGSIPDPDAGSDFIEVNLQSLSGRMRLLILNAAFLVQCVRAGGPLSPAASEGGGTSQSQCAALTILRYPSLANRSYDLSSELLRGILCTSSIECMDE
jgi:hypothetical protein